MDAECRGRNRPSSTDRRLRPKISSQFLLTSVIQFTRKKGSSDSSRLRRMSYQDQNERRLGCPLALLSIVIGLSGCASVPDDTPESAAYYQLFDCNQLAEHASQISVTAAELAGFGPHRCVAAPNVVIFWPAAFARNVEEAQRLKNEFEAVQKASLEKSCSIRFQARPTIASHLAC